jgi:hypothetical protein
MTDAKARLLQMIADEPHMAGGGLRRAIGKAQKVAKAAEVANTGARAILPAVEREANLAKMLADSKVKDRLYHGTKGNITKFEKSRTGKGSTMFGDYDVERHGTFLTPDHKLANEFALQGRNHTGANVMPLYASLKNPLDMTGGYNDELFNKVSDWGDKQGLNGYRVARHLGDNWGDWQLFDKDAGQDPEFLIKMLKDLGYDSAKIHEPPVAGEGASGLTYVAFEPTQIKSAIGNQGTYDLTEPDINKAGGGAVHMAGGGLRRAVTKAQKTAKAAEEVKAMRLYHGSPHVMAPTPENKLGKFDPTKIGTGEGAQMYGRGHYLAQSRDVAKNYRPRSPKYEAKLVKEYKRAEAAQNYPKMEVLEDAMLHRAPDELVSKYSNAEEGYTPEHAKAAADYAKWYEANRPEVGGVYHVDLPQDYLANMLDYDKPINQHPEQVKALLERAGINTYTSATAGSMIGGQEAHLAKHGIPGMAYDDTTGAGTRNFVVFPGNEDMLNIVQRDKKGGAVHMAGGGRTPKYPWERYEQPKKVAEMRARQINPVAGAVKKGADYATQLIDKGPSFSSLVGGLVGAVPFVGPDLRKRMEASNISIPTDFTLGSNMPAEDYEYGQPMQYRKPGISTTSVPTKDVLEALNVSDFVGTPGLSKVAEDIGYGQTPDPLDLLDAASAAALGYGAIKGGIKGGRKAAGALSDLAKSEAGYKLAQKALNYVPAAQPMNVVKPTGGNWLSGSVEQALKPLRKTGAEERAYMDFVRQQREAGDDYANWVTDKVMKDPSFQKISGIKAANQYLAEKGMKPLQIEPREQAMNDWVDRNLTNYVKKQMATPDDPVRKLAEQGVLHGPMEAGLNRVPENVKQARFNAGMLIEGEGQSELARAWEHLSDASIKPSTVERVAAPEPWMEKADPNTSVYALSRDFSASRLGFDHIVDVLNEDLAAGRIRPEQLNKISMEQAVRRTYEYDQEMAKKMRETQAKITEGMPVYKEYPEGYKWVELSQPKELPKGWSQEPSGAYVGPKGERTTVNPNYETLEQALKYEGNKMGHCVGGYCPDVVEGKSRIFSLRDAKGEPHVTIEVKPQTDVSYFSPWQIQLLRSHGKLVEQPSIVQIKGKQNRAPKEDYLPFVQDFVKGGQWSDVGDLQNTGLRPTKDAFNETEQAFLKSKGVELKPYIDPEETARYQELFKQSPPEPGMAEGGAVSGAKQRLLDMIAKEPHMGSGGEVHMAGGGEVHMGFGGVPGKAKKLANAAKAAEKKVKVEHPLVFPRAAAKTLEDIRPIAQRMAEQVTGEFVKQNPKNYKNPAGKSRKQFERERSIPLETRNVVPERPAPDVNYEDYKGYGLVGVPGDPTMGGVAKRGSLEEVARPTVELTRVGDITPDYPVPLFGGPRYGDENKFWASDLASAVPVQNSVNELAKLYEFPILGKYIKMADNSENFALHNLDALLSIQRPEKLSKAKMAELTELIRAGSPDYGKFPGFTGFKDPADVLLQAQMNSKLRKHIAETLRKPTITNALGLPNGLDVVAAITHPELRNLETGASGFSVGKMKPGAALQRGESSHPTYDTDIPGSFLGRSRYPTPYEIAFPDTIAYTRSKLTPGVDEFSMMKMLGPRERIDQQYIDEMKMYEQLMKQYTGKKKGGLAHTKKVKRHGDTVSN